jgi:hypothetical protein
MLIGITLAEIAEIAEIAGDVDPMLIGVTLAETSVTGRVWSIPLSVLIRSPGSCFCPGSAQWPPPDGVR